MDHRWMDGLFGWTTDGQQFISDEVDRRTDRWMPSGARPSPACVYVRCYCVADGTVGADAPSLQAAIFMAPRSSCRARVPAAAVSAELVTVCRHSCGASFARQSCASCYLAAGPSRYACMPLLLSAARSGRWFAPLPCCCCGLTAATPRPAAQCSAGAALAIYSPPHTCLHVPTSAYRCPRVSCSHRIARAVAPLILRCREPPGRRDRSRSVLLLVGSPCTLCMPPLMHGRPVKGTLRRPRPLPSAAA
jgi:hypothetical protein